MVGDFFGQMAHVIAIFPHKYHNNHVHDLTITLNYPEATVVEQVRYAVSESSLLASVMVDHPII